MTTAQQLEAARKAGNTKLYALLIRQLGEQLTRDR